MWLGEGQGVSNSPPWLLAPEIHISGRTRVRLAPGRCHSKLGVGEESQGANLSTVVFPRVTGEVSESKGLEPLPVGGAAPLSGGALTSQQDHKEYPIAHRPAFNHTTKHSKQGQEV